MTVNKTGVASLVAGVAILAVAWYFAFFNAGAVPFAQSIVDLIVNGIIIGGAVWLGVLLAVLGLLILVI